MPPCQKDNRSFFEKLQKAKGLDLRDNRGKRHDLAVVLVGVTLALLSNRDGCLSSIHRHLQNHYEKLVTVLEVEKKQPVSRSQLPLILEKVSVKVFDLATDYEVEMVVPDGKKSKETDVVLRFNEKNFEAIPDKKSFSQHTKNFNFSDIKTADYSYAKKPMISGGGAVATALLVGFIFATPFLFIKKKTHWLSVQTGKEFAVLKLDGSNYRAIIAEFETHGVKVTEVKEEKENKKGSE